MTSQTPATTLDERTAMTDHRQTVIDLVKRSRFAMLTTRTAEGTMISRPLTVQEVTEEGDIYFIVPGDGDAAREADRLSLIHI